MAQKAGNILSNLQKSSSKYFRRLLLKMLTKNFHSDYKLICRKMFTASILKSYLLAKKKSWSTISRIRQSF